MKKITVVAGTRPEIIKLAPLIEQLRDCCDLSFVATGQHDEMSIQALDIFNLKPELSLELMQKAQTPSAFISIALPKLNHILASEKPDVVIAQGDTATTFATALASFHAQIPFAHVEAGLRTGNLDSPFPEEAYRSMLSRIATFHFCPTPIAVNNLSAEGITKNVYLTGNTVVDALNHISEKIKADNFKINTEIQRIFEEAEGKQLILVTGHRRENHHQPLEVLCQSIKHVANKCPKTHFVFPVHLNPVVSELVYSQLANINNVSLIAPLDYLSTISLLLRADLVVTDSGGIQEEAPYCNTFILVTRENTERPEVVGNGFGKLLPLTSVEIVAAEIENQLEHPTAIPKDKPFGDGTAAAQIKEILCSS
ncbi:UNVERIFIED_CONTAM: hypothetical protein GTU68_051339 [Idotea baltica]|nr:hypothetical protein [Idotea baltica]